MLAGRWKDQGAEDFQGWNRQLLSCSDVWKTARNYCLLTTPSSNLVNNWAVLYHYTNGLTLFHEKNGSLLLFLSEIKMFVKLRQCSAEGKRFYI